MDRTALQDLGQRLLAYNGSTEYWDAFSQSRFVGKLKGADALHSFNRRTGYPSDEELDEVTTTINTKVRPIIEFLGDMEFWFWNIPKVRDYSCVDGDPTEFSFYEDAELLDELYEAFKEAKGISIDVDSMRSLNDFLKELQTFPDLSHFADAEGEVANFMTLWDLQNSAKNTTVCDEIDTLVSLGNGGDGLADEVYPVKELGAIRLCRDLVVRKHYGEWYGNLEVQAKDVLGNLNHLLDYDTDAPSKWTRDKYVRQFLLALSVQSRLDYPLSMTNWTEYNADDFEIPLPDLANYVASLIDKYLNNSSGQQQELIASISSKLKFDSLTELQNLSALTELDAYDNSATFGNFVPNGSYGNIEELKNMWDYVDETSGTVPSPT